MISAISIASVLTDGVTGFSADSPSITSTFSSWPMITLSILPT